jgi:hypothetical protein
VLCVHLGRLVGARINSVRALVNKFHSIKVFPSSQEVDSIVKALPDDSLPIGALLTYLARMPVGFVIDVVDYLPIVLLVWFLYPYLPLHEMFRFLAVYMCLVYVKRSPFKHYRIGVKKAIGWV